MALYRRSQAETKPNESLSHIRLMFERTKGEMHQLFRTAIPENREFQKLKFSFFSQRQALLTSFDIVVVTYRVTNILPKLVNMLLFSMEKTEFPFLVFPYFRVMPFRTRVRKGSRKSGWSEQGPGERSESCTEASGEMCNRVLLGMCYLCVHSPEVF